MLDNLNKGIDTGKLAGALLTDLSKAFDCLNHELLMSSWLRQSNALDKSAISAPASFPVSMPLFHCHVRQFEQCCVL